MDQVSSVRKEVVNREVVVIFAILIGFFAITNLKGIPLEPIADLIFSGYWMLRQELLVGGFLMQLFLTWLWFFTYAYLLAIIIASVYRR